MSREKMPLSMRAKIFLPFDAVKGLSQALRLKEYEQESVAKGRLEEDEARELSSILSSLNGGEYVEARRYESGRYVFVDGLFKAVYDEGYILVGETKVRLNELFGIKVLRR